jgi:3-methylfumaryl-CoA hydratase
MADVDIDYLRGWIGREQVKHDVITPRLAISLNAIFDIGDELAIGDPAPAGIQWCLAPDIVPMSGLGPDGHPSRGGFLPPVPFPRRMWAGGELTFSGEFRVGDEVARRSVIEDVVLKSGRSGQMIFVTVRHEYQTARGVVLSERQDIVYRQLESGKPASSQAPAASVEPIAVDRTRSISGDAVLLFRYSAVTFNGHRIHYDQPYVTGEEGYPGLIFHGPLQANYLLNLAIESLGGRMPRTFAFRSVSPLFGGQTVTLNAKGGDTETKLWVADAASIVTMTATAS